MATTLFLRSQATLANGLGPLRQPLSTTAGASTTSLSKNIGVVPCPWSNPASAQVRDHVCWVSPPVAAEVTITAAPTVRMYCLEDNMAANVGAAAYVGVITGAQEFIQWSGVDGIEFGTAAAAMDFALSTSTLTLNAGDRLVIFPFIVAVGVSGGSAYNASLYYDGPADSVGGSYVSFTETITFSAEPSVTADYSDGAGYTLFSTDTTATASKLACVSETYASVASSIAFTYSLPGSWSPQALGKGFMFMGQRSGAYSSAVYQLTYATDTFAQASGVNGTTGREPCSVYSATRGYSLGHRTSAGAYSTGIPYYEFATGTGDWTAAVLDYGAWGATGFCSPTKGFKVGGQKAGAINDTNVGHFTFATETYANASTAIAAAVNGGPENLASSTTGYAVGSASQLVFTVSTSTYTTSTSATMDATEAYAGLTNNSNGYYSGRPKTVNSVSYTYALGRVAYSNGTASARAAGLPTTDATIRSGLSNYTRALLPVGTGSNTLAAFTSAATGTVPSTGPTGAGANTVDAFTSAGTASVTTTAATHFLIGLGGSSYIPAGGYLLATNLTSQYAVPTYLYSLLSATLGTPAQSSAQVGTDSARYLMGGSSVYEHVTGDESAAVQKFAVPSRTASTLGGALQAIVTSLSSIPSATHGYAVGGYNNTGRRLAIDRLTYSNEAITNNVAALAGGAINTASLLSNSAGYVFLQSNTTDLNKFTLATEVLSTVTAASYNATLGGNSLTAAGYAAGTTNGTKLTFATETTATASFLPAPADLDFEAGNGGATGYYATNLGNYPDSANLYSFTSSETPVQLGSTLQTTASLFASVGLVPAVPAVGAGANTLDDFDGRLRTFGTSAVAVADVTSGAVAYKTPGNNKGFIAGGDNGSTVIRHLQRVNFQDGTAYTVSTTALPSAIAGGAGVCDGVTGYVCGGYAGGTVATVYKVFFSTETCLLHTVALPTARKWSGGASSPSKGYVAGGSASGDVSSSLVEGITFSNGANFSSSAVLSSARYSSGGLASETGAYFAGGVVGGVNQNAIDKLVFSGETLSTLTTTLVVARQTVAGVASSQRGYWLSGNNGADSAEVDGVRFSDDAAVNPSATVATARYAAPAVSGFPFGAIMGGASAGAPVGTKDVFTFASESFTLNDAHVIQYNGVGVSARSELYLGTGSTTLVAVTSTAAGLAGDPILTGSGANTLDALDSAATGVTGLIPRTGTGANTLAAFTAAASGLQLYIGSGANTTTQSSAGVGQVIPISTGAGSNTTAQSSVGAGQVAVSGVGSGGPTMSSAGVGTVSITGMGGQGFIEFMQQAVGGVLATGAFIPATLDAFSNTSSFGYVTDFVPASHDAKMAALGAQADPVPIVAVSGGTEIIATV